MSIDNTSTEDDSQRERTGFDQGTGTEGHVRLENVTKTFNNGEIVATDNVNLSIGSSEFVVLLGPSGCGKTTTLRCIAGLEIPDSGHIIVDEEDITKRKPKDRNLAFVFQSIALFPHMSVRDNMRFGLDMNSDISATEKERRVEEAAEILGLEGMLDRKPSALSGGQRQRVALGRAMIIEPAAFLLDEPFSALDANLRDQMRVEVKKLQRDLETAMIFVTHDQEEAMTIGDKIVVMNDGATMQIGSPYDIYNEPENRFVAQFIGSPSTNFFECKLEQRDGEYVLENDLFSFVLGGQQSTNLSVTPGTTVEIGIRPEYITVNPEDPLFDAEITVIEPHGSRDSVYLHNNGTELTATTDQNAVTSSDDTVSVGFERDQVWLFDTDGKRIL
jgi:multiple sugar transport system ATP-binding protein